MEGATIYIAGFNVADDSIASGEPCKLCRRMIQNAKIALVVYQNAEGGLMRLKPSEIIN